MSLRSHVAPPGRTRASRATLTASMTRIEVVAMRLRSDVNGRIVGFRGVRGAMNLVAQAAGVAGDEGGVVGADHPGHRGREQRHHPARDHLTQQDLLRIEIEDNPIEG